MKHVYISGYAVVRYGKTDPLPDNDAYKLESALHEHFTAYRTLGEFFEISFNEVRYELERRVPHVEEALAHPELTFEEKVDFFIRTFARTFCTTDKNMGDFCGVGILKDYLKAFSLAIVVSCSFGIGGEMS